MSDRPRTRRIEGSFFSEVPVGVRLTMWAVIVAATTVSAPPHPARRYAALALILLAAVAIQPSTSGSPRRRAVAVVLTTLASYGAMLAAPSGYAEIPVFMAATRIPFAFRGRLMWALVAVDVVATDVILYVISGSPAVLLAGFGIPLLVQRGIDHRDLVAERDRAQALLAELRSKQDIEVQAAALQERSRIARDMHDVLAHSLAGLSLQLQATRAVAVRAGTGPEVLEPLDKAAALAREGLAEAREAVGALGEPGGLGLEAIPALVDRHPGDVRLTATGAAAAVPPETAHALYRMVQESLTNAARYAPGSPVTVVLDWQPRSLTLTVDDDGPAPGHRAATGQGTGLGLAGMQDRLARSGAALRAGPRPDGGWRVQAQVVLP